MYNPLIKDRGVIVKKFDSFLNKFEEIIIILALFSGATMLFINVILRFFFSSGIVWAEEFTRFAIIWLTFLGSSIAAREGAHLGVTVLLEVVKDKKFHKVINNIVYILAIGFSMFLVMYGGRLTFEIFGHKTVSSSMQIPMYLIYMAIPLGGLLMTYRYIRMMINYNQEVKA